MEIDIKKLKGNDLYRYITSAEFPDREFAGMVELLMYATMYDMDKALKLLEHVVQHDKELVAVYPGIGDVVPDGAEPVGDIADGELYIV